jgi:hypothetical protein
MRHRSGRDLRRTSARDPRVLLVVVGVVLVFAALALSMCEQPADLLGGLPVTWAGASPGGELA